MHDLTPMVNHAITRCTLYANILYTGDSEIQRTMLELLNQLDGFEATQNINVVMATNCIDIIISSIRPYFDWEGLIGRLSSQHQMRR